jgi:hypothetical protein
MTRLEQEVDPRLHIRDTILDRGEQELPNIRPEYRREPNEVLPSQSPSANIGRKATRIDLPLSLQTSPGIFPKSMRIQLPQTPFDGGRGSKHTLATVLCVPYASAGLIVVDATNHLSNPTGPPSSGEKLSLAAFMGIQPPSYDASVKL